MKKPNNVILIPRNAKMLLAFLVVYVSSMLNASAGMLGSSPNPGPDGKAFLSTLTGKTDLVFKGTLNEISNGLSIENIPYTFITYSVDEVIAGKYQQDSITLKFVGGEFPNGNRLTASNAPEVTLGEEAILFVQQRLDTGCDITNCQHGRFVINNGSIIAANDSALFVDDGNIKFIPAGEAGQKAETQKQANLAQFKSHIAKLSEGQAGQKQPFINRDKKAPFKAYAGLTQAGQAPKMLDSKTTKTKGESGAKDMSPHDLWEIHQLKENNGNPVFK